MNDFWEGFLKIQVYEQSIVNTEETGDEMKSLREEQIICKPIAMRALALAYQRLINVPEGEPRISLKDFVSKVNDIDWDPENPLWDTILILEEKLLVVTLQ